MAESVLRILRRQPTKATHPEDPVSVNRALGKLDNVVKGMWAPPTLEQRKRLWSRFMKWAIERNLTNNADTAVLFTVATGAKPQGLLNYAKGLSAIMKKIGRDNQPPRSLAAALRADGAAIPESQATPIKKEVLMQRALEQKPDLKATAIIAWKTMPRWGEVAKLSSVQFINLDPLQVIIDWGQTPKGKKSN